LDTAFLGAAEIDREEQYLGFTADFIFANTFKSMQEYCAKFNEMGTKLSSRFATPGFRLVELFMRSSALGVETRLL